MNRAGLVNFWYYDEETFDFADGKMLLRGANGSGKSVTMQSFLPVLLDGRKSPDRLDPFGSKARKMQDYLLGEKEVTNRDERTGYLFLEYVKKGTGQYITTGIGMQAKRNKQMKSWYFVITDNRRIGFDFSLTQDHTGEKIPFSEKELTNRIATGGHVVGSQREYMELVNRYVFGFQSTDAYEDLIKLLIQLRSPKLSKDFRPTVIYEILDSALPPLTDDEIRYLSDSIDQMDQVQQELENLANQKKAVDRLVDSYDRYNQYVLAERAQQWRAAEKNAALKQKEVAQFFNQTTELTEEIAVLYAEEKQLDQKLQLLEIEKEQLRSHEVWSLEKRKEEIQTEKRNKSIELTRIEQNRSTKQRDYGTKKEDLDKQQLAEHREQQEMNNLLENMRNDAEESHFSGHDVNQADFKRLMNVNYGFTVWRKAVSAHSSTLVEALKLVEEKVRLQERFSELEKHSSQQKQKVDHAQRQIEHSRQWFEEELQKLESAIFEWIKIHPELTFESERKQQIARLVQGLYLESSFDHVKIPINDALSEYQETIHIQKLQLENQLSQVIGKIDEKNNEITRLKSQKMIEPERAEGTSHHREKLRMAGQYAVPFYEAVEFQEHVTEKQRSRIEAVLRQTGVLDSLISTKEIEPLEDTVIVENPLMMTLTLADYLQPDLDGQFDLSSEKVDAVLRSIPLEQTEGAFAIDPNGSYTMGILKGHAPLQGAAKFIGRASRKRYLKEQLEKLTDEIYRLNEDKSNLIVQVEEVELRLQEIKQWQQEIPSDDTLQDIHKVLLQLDQERKLEQALLDQIDSQWKEVRVKLETLKPKLHTYSSHFGLEMKEDYLKRAMESIYSYQEDIRDLENSFVKWQAIRSKIHYLEQALGDLEDELDYLKGQMTVTEDAISAISKEAESIEKQLALQGMEEIRREVQRVQTEFTQTNEKLRGVKDSIPQKKADLGRAQEKREDATVGGKFWTQMRDEWEQLVTDEVNREFVAIEQIDAKTILAEFEDVLASYEKSKVQEQLTKIFLEEQSILSEYRPANMTEDKKVPVWMSEEQPPQFEAYVRDFVALKDRRLIRVYYNGSPTDPYYLRNTISKTFEDQQRHLDEQDRQLYEDIMLNHIGTILRSRIKRAANWVKKMDQIMSERDNSSGLIFSIAWKAKTADSEDEMDTADLVKLLERDSKYLHEEDLTKITSHFQSRISRAKELISLRNEGSTLHQVLKEVLDYRNWFSFVLSFKRENEPSKRELTNNAFFQFSGGEKAMAMYIPLFTAAYSRYKEASSSAPYIISLDEAFAGVDENNIRDMFEVVEQLGFNYIMNSQALWGDYDTVPALAIADLLRPKNADFVTVMRYKWDGVKRTPVYVEVEENEVYEGLKLT